MKTLLKILLLTDIFNAMLWRLYLHTILTELNCHTLLVYGPITFILLTSSPSSLISCCSLINFCCGDSIFIPSSPTYRKIWICVKRTCLLLYFYLAIFLFFFFSIISEVLNLPVFIKCEPQREKNGLHGFRPGLRQTDLCSHRRRLDA